MKKIVCLILFLSSNYLLSNSCKRPFFSGALTAGYIFKTDHHFKEVYGNGVANAITADGCFYFLKNLGIGAKVSYWLNHGKTTFLKLPAHLQEVPVTAYLRGIYYFDCGLQPYISLGGGFVWLKEKSYMGTVKFIKGIGEAEIGLNYNIWKFINLTSAFRYLFPKSKHNGMKIDVGGFDLRAGIQFSF